MTVSVTISASSAIVPTDLVNWKWIQDSQTQPYYSPKHGTVILISKKELKKMKKLLRGREKQKQQAHLSR